MKKIYIPIIISTMAISLFLAACGSKNNMPNTTTSTTTTTSTASTDKNMLEEGMTSISSKLSEAGSEIRSDISKMR